MSTLPSPARGATLLLALFATAQAALPAGDDVILDLGRGPVTIHVPDSYADGVPAPLVILLHGYSASGASVESYLGLLPLSEEYGFLYAFPDGTVDALGNRFWNATDACCNFFGSGVDDAGYLRSLVEAVEAALDVDPRRIHFVGHSNGGFMSYRMACESADKVASIASIAGATFKDELACVPTEPVHTLQIHGTSDSVIQYGGGSLGGASYPGAIESTETWAAYATCSLTPDLSAPPLDLVAGLSGSETTVRRYEAMCLMGGSGEHWRVNGGSHSPNWNGSFGPLLVEFLLAHPKPGAGESYCTATPSSTGFPALIRGEGSSSISNDDLVLAAEPAPADQFGLFFYGPSQTEVPFGNGFLCVAPGAVGLQRLPVTTVDFGGTLSWALDYSAPPSAGGEIQPGSHWNFQAWFRDPFAGGAFFDTSDGLSVVFHP